MKLAAVDLTLVAGHQHDGGLQAGGSWRALWETHQWSNIAAGLGVLYSKYMLCNMQNFFSITARQSINDKKYQNRNAKPKTFANIMCLC